MGNILKWCKKPNNYQRALSVWIDKLTILCISLFEYKNLPANLPYWELEKRLIFAGRAVIFKTDLYGIVTADGGTSGVDIYNNRKSANFAQTILGSKSNLLDGINCVIAYGCSLDKITGNSGALGRKIYYYADLLANVDVSRKIALINERATKSVIAKSDSAVTELKQFYNKLLQGEYVVPKIVSGVLEATESLLKGGTSDRFDLQDYDTAQQNILKMFYNDVGVSFATDKRERLLTDEIASDNDSLSLNVYDMIKCRQAAVSQINLMYGSCIEVEVNNNVIT